MKKVVIILAAGSSERYSTPHSKLFEKVGGKPTIVYSIKAFTKAVPDSSIILVLQKPYMKAWKKAKKKYFSKQEIKIVEGGKTRMESVKNALKLVKGKKLVAIHDGARPAVSRKLIQKSFKVASKFGSAVPVLEMTDSLLKIKSKRIKSVNRSEYFQVQTPQVFDLKLLKTAYNKKLTGEASDDSQVWMSYYGRIKLIDGERGNLKLTFVEDLPAIKGIIKGEK